MEEKNSLRIWMLDKRKQYSPENQKLDEEKLTSQLITMEEIQNQKNFLLYYAKEPELSLHQFAKWCLEKGKNLYYPRVSGETMDFYRTRTMDNLEAGYFGIMEPKDFCECFCGIGAVCLVPGVAFDLVGNRIGYGKGFYDRYFAQHQSNPIKKIGIAYEFQVVEKINAGVFDEKMDGLVTPSKVIF